MLFQPEDARVSGLEYSIVEELSEVLELKDMEAFLTWYQNKKKLLAY